MPLLIHKLVYWLGIASLTLCLPTTAKESAKLAIIIDDVGYNLALGDRTTHLPGAFTIAVLPFTPHGQELAERAYKRGKEVMLHAPMSNHHSFPLGRGGLVNSMGQAEFLAVLRQNIANIPHIKGVNNHMGSQLTEQTEPMRWLMKELQARQLYFVDSRTSAKTQALIEAERIHLPSRKRDVFLDDKRDLQQIQQQLIVALQKAKHQGSAVAIGHPYPETLTVLKHIQPLLKQYDVELVPVSALLPAFRSQPQQATYCQAPPISFWPQTWAPVDIFNEDLFTLPEQLR